MRVMDDKMFKDKKGAIGTTVRTCTKCDFFHLAHYRPGLGRGNGFRVGNKARGIMIQHFKTAHPADYAREQDEAVGRRFAQLADWWRYTTGSSSNPRERIESDSYRDVVKLGKPVVKYILMDLIKQPDLWFPALVEITKYNPVKAGERLSIQQAADRWIAWGREKGIIERGKA